MNEEEKLWDLVREELYGKSNGGKNKKEILINKGQEIEIGKNGNIDKIVEDEEEKTPPKIIEEEENVQLFSEDFKTIHLLNEGLLAGLIYMFVIMIALSLLTIPGSISAAFGGYFGGKKAGNPARALTAAMLPFLLIAGISFIASIGALPPGSSPVDVADEIGNLINYSNDKGNLGPISKMPNSNSSVFLSLVTFSFIGGLIHAESKINRKK